VTQGIADVQRAEEHQVPACNRDVQSLVVVQQCSGSTSICMDTSNTPAQHSIAYLQCIIASTRLHMAQHAPALSAGSTKMVSSSLLQISLHFEVCI
jgi:hypothetical protein